MKKFTVILFLMISLHSPVQDWDVNSKLIQEAEKLKAEACKTNQLKDWKASQEKWEELAQQAQYLGFPKAQVLEFWIEAIWASQGKCRPPD